jgi:SAM-dependent methyltransferase
MDIEAARQVEHDKYVRAYKKDGYQMSAPRRLDAFTDLEALPNRGSYLDVSCGRGEMLKEAEFLGFGPVMGTELVLSLTDGVRVIPAWVHALPFDDKSFDVVTMFDVIEHLIPGVGEAMGDDELACRELARVAKKHILITANNNDSKKAIGEELHINKRPYETWDKLFRSWFAGSTVTWIKGNRNYVSEAWRIDL